MKPISLFILISCWCSSLSFSQATNTDSTYVKRQFSEKKIESFKADSDFSYGRAKKGESFWDRFIYWIFQTIAKIIYFSTNTLLGNILLYGGCIALLIYVVLKLLHIDAKNLFFRSSSTSVRVTTLDEDIHELDFDKLIAQAVEGRKFREAVRLTFLHALKKLSDAQLIKWVPGKTNDDYLNEIRNHPTLPQVMELRYYFDYAWYGHFEIDSNTYTSIQNAFTEFNQTLKK